MNPETSQVSDKENEDKEMLGSTAEAQTSSILETSEISAVSNGIENSAMEVSGNSTEPMSSAMTQDCTEISHEKEHMPSESNIIVVKEEPLTKEPAYVPIARSPQHTSAHFDVDANIALVDTDDMENDNNAINKHGDDHAEKLAMDAYLDGIETPMAPLRVKPEFAMQTAPHREGANSMDTMVLRPPPPPTFPSNSASDFVADGIATPRISLASINRIRVKSEFSLISASSQHTVENTQDREPGEVSPSASDDSENEPIPDDFFDDLLQDKLKERIAEAQNNDYEEKYSERLRNEKERLKDRHRNRKRAKKSKKKTKKRSWSPSCLRNERNYSNNDCEKNKRLRQSPSYNEKPSSSYNDRIDEMPEFGLRVQSIFKIKTEPGYAPKAPKNYVENVEDVEEVITPRQKRERAMQRARALLNHLKKSSDEDNSILTTFAFVSTVRKLPSSNSYVQQRIYENRSPLHTVNNVNYKFNSHATRFNLEEWGLTSLPTHAAKLAKRVGCDAQHIHNKLKTIKIPAKLRKVKQESSKAVENDEEEEEIIETTSSLYSNVMTQTDDVTGFNTPLKTKGYEIGVQVVPSLYSIGCQTLETQLPTNLHQDGDEAPIMKILHDLNENQLMAIHAFAELIKDPNVNANAMDMYKIQMKILDIYKISQIPSALVATQSAIRNNYTTMTRRSNEAPQLCIQSVKGADGKQFSVNDPRVYTKRNANDNVGSSSNYDSRYSSFSTKNYPHSSYNRSGGHGNHSSNPNILPSSHERASSAYSNQGVPHTTTKHYGRGGLRR